MSRSDAVGIDSEIRPLIQLDSNHSQAHVAAELEAYGTSCRHGLGCRPRWLLNMVISIVIPAMSVVIPSERVTVTMPADLIAGIDRFERNRSRFIATAVRHELTRRRRQELLRSLEEPHPDSLATASLGLESWIEGLPAGDDDLLDPMGGVPLRWSEEQGWQEPEA